MKKGTKHSPEVIEKMRLAKLGKVVSDEARENMRVAHLTPESIEKNRQAHIGKRASDETKAKMRAAHANRILPSDFGKRVSEGLSGKPKSEAHRINLSAAKKGQVPSNIEILKKSRIGLKKPHTEESKQKMSENRAGKCMGNDNPMWNGGISYFPYCPKFNARRTRAVRKFFGYVCLTCGKLESNNLVAGKQQSLSVHHIDHDKEQGCSGKPFNLVPLCASCHSYELHNQKDYREKINAILDNNFASDIWSRESYERDVMYSE